MSFASLETADALRGLTVSMAGLITAFLVTGYFVSRQNRKLQPETEAATSTDFEITLFAFGYILIIIALAVLAYQRIGSITVLVPEIYLATSGLLVNTVSIFLLVKNARHRRADYRKREADKAARLTRQVKKEVIKELVVEHVQNEKREVENEEREGVNAGREANNADRETANTGREMDNTEREEENSRRETQ